ncbi:MAG: carboxylesterase family protein [Gammaproteobacteria bacterium]
MLRILLILVLTVILGFLSMLTGIYFYLKPDEPLARIASPSSVRMTDYGELVGYQGRYDAHAWLGIPYAQPPVRDLRWKAPRPPLPWTGRREAFEFGDPCVQLPVLPDSDQGRGYIGNEDCLYLNIWAPTIGPTLIPTGDDRLPVMFWIHGGGNSMGSGGSEDTDLYNGSLMVSEHDVIVVSVNYRMGPLGWFAHDALMETSTTPEDASGNFGTLDLIAALRWVQANIHRFGGDPRRVTIFGESAGGSNVLSLLASPLARGLFQQAIVQSGALEIFSVEEAQQVGTDSTGETVLSSREAVARWLVNEGRAFDKQAGIDMQDQIPQAELALWLRSLTAQDLYRIYDNWFAGLISMPMIFADGYVLLDDDVERIFSDPTGYATDVPVILGSNRDEAKLFMAFLPEYVEINDGWPTDIKDLEVYNRDASYGSRLWRVANVDRLADAMSLNTPDHIFAYRFDADDWRNLGFIDLKDLLGAAHALDLAFVFGNFPPPSRLIFPGSTFDAVELLSGSMMSYWAEFAHSGNPGQGRLAEDPAWQPWRQGNANGNLLILDTELDGGIRMVQEVLTLDGIKAEFFSDPTFSSAAERCDVYRWQFRDEYFVPAEYESMGCR